MTIKLTAASFLNGVRNSGLVEAGPLETVIREMRAAGSDVNDSRVLADELIRREFLTSWQSEKLLQGRHKGFFLGRYRLMRLLGTGQMSAVYLGRHIYMDHLVAIKVLPADKVGDTSYLSRFYREAKAVASLGHPNIIRAFDVDKQVEAGTDIHFLVMEYIEGRPLTQLVGERQDQKMDLVSVVDIIRQAADGLAHAHTKNLVHRDIKPDNLIVTPTGDVKILDLGLARFFKTTDEESLTLKHDERVIGTADYLAPEQAIDSHSVDSRADIYGLGCTFYFALTGHPPFTEGTLVQRLMAHQSQVPPPVTKERPEVPASLTRILDRMLAKKREDRYQTGRDVSDDLTAWLFENAPHEWKERRLPMYVALRLKDLLNSATATTTAKNISATASIGNATARDVQRESTPTVPKNDFEGTKTSVDLEPVSRSPVTRPKPAAATKTAAAKALDADTTKSVSSKSAGAVGSKTAALSYLARQELAKSRSRRGGLIGVVRQHPAVTIVLSVVAAAMVIAASVFLWRGPASASANDHSPSAGDSARTGQSAAVRKVKSS